MFPVQMCRCGSQGFLPGRTSRGRTDGYVQVDGSYMSGLERQYIEGVYWYEGYLSPYFVTDPVKQEARLEAPGHGREGSRG